METFVLQSALKALGLDPGPIDGMAKEGGPTYAAVDALLARNASRLEKTVTTRARKLVAAEQLIYWSRGIEVGKIDGLVGPSVRQARIEYMALSITGTKAEPWRDALMASRPTDHSMPAPVRTVWPRQAEVEKYFGPIGKNQAKLVFPYKMKLDWNLRQTVTTTMVHEKIHDPALRVFKRILDHYGEVRIAELGLDQFAGCYNPRKMRGGTLWSMHAWAIAFDFDADRNQLNWGRDKAVLARPDYDAFWSFWTEEGFLSLGKARNFDWMHVQAARL